MLVTDWPKLTLAERAAGHALITAAPFLTYWLGGLIRGRRFQNKILPLLVQTAEERAGGLPKSGNAEGVTIAMGAQGGVTLRITTTPQGQGHRTVAAQVAADVLGLENERLTALLETIEGDRA